jgi:cysteine synthase B
MWGFLFFKMITTGTKQEEGRLEKRIKEIESQIGNTPVHEVNRQLYHNARVSIFGKMEWLQLGGSIKARAAYAIIRSAIEKHQLNERTILLDATSGNTGIAYAAIAREIGLKVSLCLPENASQERKEILTALEVDIIYTSPLEGTDGSQQVAQDLVKKNPRKYFYADQYKNENNWKAHYNTTALEIVQQVPGITHFIAGLGTTGTFVGTGRSLRELKPEIKLIALQPDSALHGLEGWKHLQTAVVPKIYDDTVADEVLEVTTEESYDIIRKVNDVDGLLLSPSSAANIAGAIKIADRISEGTIVTVLPDNADKYSEVIRKLIKK